MGLKEVGIRLVTEGGDAALKALGQFGQGITSLGKQTEQAGRGINAFGEITTGALRRVGEIAVDSLAKAGGALVGFFKDSIKEANESEAVQAQLAAVLKSTGGAAGVTADMVNSLASQYQGLTKFSDEQVGSAENLLLTFTRINSDVFPQATALALDMSQALGQDLKSSSIQLGKALNDPIQGLTALQRVGVSFTEQQKAQIQAMVQAGDVMGAQKIILAELSKEFGGSAVAAGRTFEGQMIILQHQFSDFKEGVGTTIKQALLPLLEILSAHLPSVFAALTKIVQDVGHGFQTLFAIFRDAPSFIDGVTQAIERLFPGLGAIAKTVFTYGANIIDSLVTGMKSAFAHIVAVLQQIGSVIAHWLKPGSPPKITPDLDKWGAEAATVYMDGWKDGDFSALNDLGDAIQRTLKGLVDTGSLGKTDVIPLVFGSQQAISKAINEMETLGSVSEDTLQSIVSAAGPAGSQVDGLIRSYFDLEKATQEVQRAQQELNNITAEYADQLAPLEGSLKQIRDRKQEIQDMQRIDKLQKTLTDDKASASDKELAQLEINEIQTEHQIKGIEDERDVAVGAAQAKVDAAKAEQQAAEDRLNVQQKTLEFYNQQNQLVAEQTRLLEELAQASEQAASGGGGGGLGGLGDIGSLGGDLSSVTAPLEQVGTVLSNVSTTAATAKEGFVALSTSITDRFAPIFATLAPIVSPFIDLIKNNLDPILHAIISLIGSEIIVAIGGAVAAFTSVVAPIAAAVAIGATLYKAWQDDFGGIRTTVETVFAAIGQVIQSVLTVVGAFVQEHSAEITQFLTGAWQTIQSIVTGALQIIRDTVVPILTGIAEFIIQHKEQIVAVLSDAWNIISTVISTALSVIQGVIKTVLAVIHGDWDTAWQSFKGIIDTIWEGIKTVVSNAVDAVAKILGDAWNAITGGVNAAWDGIASKIQSVADTIKGIVETVKGYVQDIEDFVGGAKAAARDLATTQQQVSQSTPGRAIGGPVQAMTKYLVGEQGPEFFVPGRSGTILPTPMVQALVQGAIAAVGSVGGGRVAPPATPQQILSGGATYNQQQYSTNYTINAPDTGSGVVTDLLSGIKMMQMLSSSL